jgi:alkylhydroperoxidase/carboxymuconolactone decarboxylase family protein
MTDSHYDRAHLRAFGRIAEGEPELAAKFFGYYGACFQPGALSVREKALTALAVAHVVQCPYCIDAYTSGSLEKGADLEQMTEAVHAAAAVRSASVMSYGLQMLAQGSRASMGARVGTRSHAYFDKSHTADRRQIASASPELGAAYFAWEDRVFEDGALSEREKHLIALACAHALQCPYSIERHTAALLARDVPLAELTEAVHVAGAIRGGASLVHGVQMLTQTENR